MIFVASDIHFNHLNIPVYCKESRGHIGPEWVWDASREQKWPTWNNISAMNEVIINNWNSIILNDDDEVYIIGDVAMGLIEKAPALIKRLNGKKYLIKGNHDRGLIRYLDTNPDVKLFEWIKDYHELHYEGHLISMCHYPIAHWNKKCNNGIMLHGHLHGSPSGIDGWIKDVGIDTNQLIPYRLTDIIKELKKLPEGDFRHEN